MHSVRPMILGADPRDPCAHCDARHHSMCTAIPDQDLARLAAASVVKEYSRGQVFIHESEPARDFFNVTAGTVKLFKLLPDGRQQVTGFAGMGHFLGLAVSDVYAFSAEAIDPVRVCRFSREKMKALIDDFPALEQRLLATACNELVAAQEHILTLGRKTAQERVASFLVFWERSSALCDNRRGSIPLPMTRGEIADYLGLTIETVSRTLSRFRAERRIETPTQSNIILLDRVWLEDVAAGTH